MQGKAEEQPSLLLILYQALPFLLILGIFLRSAPDAEGRRRRSGAMGFGKSKAKLLTEKHGRVTFEDVAGIDEAREELQGKSSNSSRTRTNSRAWAARFPGALSNRFARHLRGDTCSPAQVPVRQACPSSSSISGSDFVEMFVGVGAGHVATCSNRPRRTRRASSSSTKSTPWAGTWPWRRPWQPE